MRGQPAYVPGDSRYAQVRRINVKGTGSKTVWAATEIRDATVLRVEITFANSALGTDTNAVTFEHGFSADSLTAAANVATATGDAKASGQVDNLRPWVKVDVAPASASATWEGYVEYV